MVEDEATLKLLRRLKVDFAQGFGISRPMPLATIRATAQEGLPALASGQRLALQSPGITNMRARAIFVTEVPRQRPGACVSFR